MFQNISSKKKNFQKFFSPIYLVYLWIYLHAKASPGLGLQSKDWEKRLRLGPSVSTGLALDRGPDSVFRKGLGITSSRNCHPVSYVLYGHAEVFWKSLNTEIIFWKEIIRTLWRKYKTTSSSKLSGTH